MTYYEPAPHLKRIFAAIVDLSLILFVTNAIALKFMKVLKLDRLLVDPVQKIQSGEVKLVTLWLFVLLLVVITTLMHYYFVWFETNKGATPGKMLVNLEVISQDGDPLTKSQAVRRELARWYLDIPFVLVSLIVMFATNKRVRFGDIIAKTQVIQRKTLPDSAPRKVVHARTPTRPQGS